MIYNAIMNKIGKLTIQPEISKHQIDQLITYSNSDPQVIAFTSDPSRFKDRAAFNKWLEKGRSIYTLTDDNGDLLGIVWFGQEYLSGYQQCGFTFAVRTYGPARGQHLASKLITSAFESFQKTDVYQRSSQKGVWLETSADNLAAVSTYTKFGFKKITEPDDKNKIIMIYP
jgi:ribosomal protein S18 acetylase RimI-like enzyme